MNNKALKEKKVETIVRIMGAAREIFAEVGFAGARVDEIAKRAGVNKAMIYYRIGDKADLYAKVLHDAFSGTAARMALNIKETESPEEQLKVYIRNIVQTIEQYPHVSRIMMREVASGAENLAEIVVNDLVAILGTLGGILTAGEKSGVFDQANPLIIHMMILGAAAFYKNMASVRKSHPAFPEDLRKLDKKWPGGLAEEIERLVLRAVRK